MMSKNDDEVRLVISTVDGHLSALPVRDTCEAVLMDTDLPNSKRAVSELVCEHTDTVSVWKYLGYPL